MTVADSLDDLAGEFRRRFGDVAEVHRSAAGEWPSVSVGPFATGAEGFSCFDGGGWLSIIVGDHVYWELDDDVASVRPLVDAVVAGRGYEVTGPWRRYQVVLTLADGRVEKMTQIDGCLPGLVPLPFWPRRSPRRHFAPYR